MNSLNREINGTDNTSRLSINSIKPPTATASPTPITDDNGDTISFASLSTLDPSYPQHPKTLSYKHRIESNSRIRIPSQQAVPQVHYPEVLSPVMMPPSGLSLSSLTTSSSSSSSIFNSPIVNSSYASTSPVPFKCSGLSYVSPQINPQKDHSTHTHSNSQTRSYPHNHNHSHQHQHQHHQQQQQQSHHHQQQQYHHCHNSQQQQQQQQQQIYSFKSGNKMDSDNYDDYNDVDDNNNNDDDDDIDDYYNDGDDVEYTSGCNSGNSTSRRSNRKFNYDDYYCDDDDDDNNNNCNDRNSINGSNDDNNNNNVGTGSGGCCDSYLSGRSPCPQRSYNGTIARSHSKTHHSRHSNNNNNNSNNNSSNNHRHHGHHSHSREPSKTPRSHSKHPRKSMEHDRSVSKHKRGSSKSSHSSNHRHSHSHSHSHSHHHHHHHHGNSSNSKHKHTKNESSESASSGSNSSSSNTASSISSNSNSSTQSHKSKHSHKHATKHSKHSSNSSKYSFSSSSTTNSASVTPQSISAATSPDFFSEHHKSVSRNSYKPSDSHQPSTSASRQMHMYSPQPQFHNEKQGLFKHTASYSMLPVPRSQSFCSIPRNAFSPPLFAPNSYGAQGNCPSSSSSSSVSSFCSMLPPLNPHYPSPQFQSPRQLQQQQQQQQTLHEKEQQKTHDSPHKKHKHRRNNSQQQQLPQIKMLLSQVPYQPNVQTPFGSYPKRSQELEYASNLSTTPKIVPTTIVNGDDDDSNSNSNSINNGNSNSITNSNDDVINGNINSSSGTVNTDTSINSTNANSNDNTTSNGNSSSCIDNDANFTNSIDSVKVDESREDNDDKEVSLPSAGDFIGDDTNPERYIIKKVVGKGAFGSVLHARDQVTQEDVALKLVLKSPEFINSIRNEIKVLELLNDADPNDDFNIQRVKRNHSNGKRCWFMYKDTYVCIVTELLEDSLYDILEKTSFYGISLNLIRNFARQILVTLSLLRNPTVSVVHCDLKPENILIANPKKLTVKIIDFGSAVCAGGTLYKYVQSRFYRAPEVILHLPYRYPVDMWSLGCILYELYVGVPLFQGHDESEQIAEFASYLGLPPEDMIIKSPVASKYFTLTSESDSSQYFELVPELQSKFTPKKLGGGMFSDKADAGCKGALDPDRAKIETSNLLNLIEQMLVYDPAERITPQQALKHNFFTEK